jgi:hypothetical protein
VREYCVACGSANIVEQPLIHHMICAYQGPEQDFRRGGELVCPKCRKGLRQFSVDYDRPGSVCVCLACGQASGDATVGFICHDCDARVRADDTGNRVVYAYFLTDAGRDCISSGSPVPRGDAGSIGARVRGFANRQLMTGQPFCVLLARLRQPAGMPAGGRLWRQTCAFFGLMMRECFTPETEIIESPPSFLALLARDSKSEVECALPEIRERLELHLALSPRIDFAVFSPEDIQSIVRNGTISA